jgi:hypothetical protein
MKLRSFALAAALALAASIAGASVVTVTPDPQPTDLPVGQIGLGETTLTHGWRIVTNALGWGKICSYGPSTYQSRTGPFFAHYLDWYHDVWHPDVNFGRGAFYATTDEFKATAPRMANDWTPSTVWLGTNTWNGTAIAGRTLGSITTMDYYAFCGKTPTRYASKYKNEDFWWEKSSWWNGPQQPIQINLTIQSPDESVTRQLWFRPWGYNFVGDDGLTEPGSQKGRWQLFHCLDIGPGSQNKWYMPPCGSSANDQEHYWYPEGTSKSSWRVMLDDSLPEGNLGQFRDWKLVCSDKSPGWPDQPFNEPAYPNITVARTYPQGTFNSTGTGYPINFFVGARVAEVLDYSLFVQGTHIRWVNSSYGERTQMDHFTLGFDGVDETYDFEPAPNDPPAQICSSSNKALDILRSPTMFAANQWNGNLFRVVGKVEFINKQWFELEDGSKLTYLDTGYNPDWVHRILPGRIRVYLPDDPFCAAPDWKVALGKTVAVTGFIEPLRFAWPDPPQYGRDPNSPLMLWSNINAIETLKNP